MASGSAQRYSAPALEKGLDILEFLAGRALPCSKADIAEALHRTPSEIYRMLSVLEQRGYVRKQGGTTSYSLSLKLFQLGHLQSGMTTLRQAIRIPMEQLADGISEACHFSIQNGNDLLVMMERMPPRRVCLTVGEGTTFPLTQTASGFVLLGQLDDRELQSYLKQDPHYQALSKTGRNEWLTHIEDVRADGYETSPSQITPGVIDTAIPIGAAGTDLFGALAVSQLAGSIADPKISRNLEAMRACAGQINLNLGV